MENLFCSKFSVQSLDEIKETHSQAQISIVSTEPSDQQIRSQSPKKSILIQTCPHFMKDMQDSIFEEVKHWFKMKGVQSGNPQEVIEKQRLEQRKITTSKLFTQNQQSLSKSSNLRERRLKKSLTLCC